MLRALKRFLPVLMLQLAAGPLFAFSLLGPLTAPNGADTYQVPAIGYQLTVPNFDRTDDGSPRNIAEDYRWNTHNVFYAYDASFLTYFGPNAATEIDKAFTTFNAVGNVDSYSADLHEWPLQANRINSSAQQFGLLDLKSFTMGLIAEQLGLDEPDRWTFCLHNRFLSGTNTCPNYTYDVIMRNYDPATDSYSPYVNGVLYTYTNRELCNASAAVLASFAPETGGDAVEVAVDPTQVAQELDAVADGKVGNGGYYTGLTRDDVGGLRYMWTSNRFQTESVDPNSLEQVTNTPITVVSSNLFLLISAETNETPAQFVANFPGLQITGSNSAG